MTIIKWIGASFIILACGGFSFMLASSYRKEERTLKSLIYALDYMMCELQFRMSALPDLCRQTARECDGVLRQVFSQLAIELEEQISPDVSRCMSTVLAKKMDIPLQTRAALELLGHNLGRFDMNGQLKGLENVRQECRVKLNKLVGSKENHLRSYQTLGLCAGAALVILLM